MHKTYGLVITNDYSRYTWVFFLTTKNETTCILKKRITEIENLVDKKVKVIRCENRKEFKNNVMNDFCKMKGIRSEFSVARTPQQNCVVERRNRLLTEAESLMENLMMAFFVGYSLNSKDFRVYNLKTRKVEENLHIRFLEDKPSIAGNGPKWLFDIDVLTKSINYVPVVADGLLFDSYSKNASNDEPQPSDDAGSPSFGDDGKKHDEVSKKENGASNELNSAFENLNTEYPEDPKMPGLETIATHDDSKEEADFTNLESSIHVFKNKKDEKGIMIKNKARLVAHGYTKEEGIDYDKVFAPVARVKAIRPGLELLRLSPDTRDRAKTTAWNKFSSTVASAINCLATNKKFNFSKYIYDHMVRNLEDEVKFLMFSRFVQVFLDSQVEGMLKHKDIYVTPSHTKKIFANVKRQGKDFSAKANQALGIRSLKRRVKKLEKKATKKAHKLKILYKICSSTRVESSEDTGLVDQEDASKHGRMIADIDADEGVALEVSTTDPVTIASEVVTTTGVEVSAAAITSQISMDEITLAKALINIKTSKPKANGIVIQEPSETSTPTPIDSSQHSLKAKDKGKAKMIEPEKSLKRKNQIMMKRLPEILKLRCKMNWKKKRGLQDKRKKKTT
nr:ribonuclease H-like domain-containing protein [Tanacetum cinerariifolium]